MTNAHYQPLLKSQNKEWLGNSEKRISPIQHLTLWHAQESAQGSGWAKENSHLCQRAKYF